MGIKLDMVIYKLCKSRENWTKVTFKHDFIKFNMTHLEDDVVSLVRKIILDLVGCLGKIYKVDLNGQRFPLKTILVYTSTQLPNQR